MDLPTAQIITYCMIAEKCSVLKYLFSCPLLISHGQLGQKMFDDTSGPEVHGDLHLDCG